MTGFASVLSRGRDRPVGVADAPVLWLELAQGCRLRPV